MSKPICLAVAVTLVSSLAYAQQPPEIGSNAADPYVFAAGGKCTSQGNWTQAALKQTQIIKDVLKSLKDNPACSSVRDAVNQSLDNMAKAAQEGEKIAEEQPNGENLGRDLFALRSFARGNEPFQGIAKKLFFGKALNHEISNALISRMQNSGDPRQQQIATTADGLSNLGRRARRTVTAGLSHFNSAVTALAHAKADCLDATQGGLIASGLVQALASFSGARHDGLSIELGHAVNSMMDLMRQEKYLQGIRKLNDRQFVSSMSCLLEATTEGYCSAMDGRHLLAEILENHRIKKVKKIDKKTGKEEILIQGESENFQKSQMQGPLAGYFIVSRQLQIVVDWLQKLQVGNSPQITTEATFQINVFNTAMKPLTVSKAIEGEFNERKSQLKDPGTDLAGRQNLLKDMILNAARRMSPSSAGMVDTGNESVNFFTQAAGGSNEVLFHLLGMPVPPAVTGAGSAGEAMFMNQPDAWLTAKFRTLPDFQHPEQSVEVVQDRMKELFVKADRSADLYYAKFYVADKQHLINDSLLGMDSNVRDALSHIDVYLKDLAERIERDKRDPTQLPSIIETRDAIGKILARYKVMRDFGMELLKNKEMPTKELNARLQKYADELIREVYNRFNVRIARSTWLANRVVGFVMLDYTMTVRDRDTLKPYLNDMLIASGYNALREMFGMSAISYSAAKSDLATALNIHSDNLEALEPVVKDVFLRHIIKLGREAEGEPLSITALNYRAHADAFNHYATPGPREKSWPVQRWFRAITRTLNLSLGLSEEVTMYGAPTVTERYTTGLGQLIDGLFVSKVRISNEFNTASDERDLLCAQALAFTNLQPYWYFCKDRMLASPLKKAKIDDPEIEKIMNTYLSIPIGEKVWEGITDREKPSADDLRVNMSARTCALRDFHRRNEIARISAAMREDGEAYESIFTKIEDNLPKATDIVEDTPEMRIAALQAEVKRLRASGDAAEGQVAELEAKLAAEKQIRVTEVERKVVDTIDEKGRPVKKTITITMEKGPKPAAPVAAPSAPPEEIDPE